jgi:hypothetical protein
MRPYVQLADRIGEGIVVALLAAQLFGVVRMTWAEDRFFSWAPHDMRTDVRIEATHGGLPVTPEAIRSRYAQPATDWHAAANVLAVVRTAESRIPAHQRWRVTVRYRVNLGAERLWVYPDSVGEH